MEQQANCQSCEQSQRCQEIYRRMGETKGPSVVYKVLAAFLLPVLVFIGVLAAFERTLGRMVSGKNLKTVFSLLSALVVTFVCILVTKLIQRRFGQR